MCVVTTLRPEFRPRDHSNSDRKKGCTLRLAMLVTALVALSGCATPALWRNTAEKMWEPHGESGQVFCLIDSGHTRAVAIFTQTAFVGGKSRKRLVAWDLSLSPEKLIIGLGSVRHFTNRLDCVRLLPSFEAGETPFDDPTPADGYLIKGSSPEIFELHLCGVGKGPYDLPSSHEDVRTTVRFAAMPLAIAADAAIVCAVCAGFAAQGISMSHF